MENKEAVREDEQQNITAEKIGGKVAGLALGISGVYRLSGGAISGLGEKVGVKNPAKGVRVVLKKGAALVDVHLVAVFGKPIPEMARNLQKEVKNLFNKEFPEYHLAAVNIWVDGLRFERDAALYRQQAVEALTEEAGGKSGK